MPSQSLSAPSHAVSSGAGVSGPAGWMSSLSSRQSRRPMFESHHTTTPTYINPMGAKGIGEAATIGATPAAANAVIDALSHWGIHHLDTPFTPEKIWRAINDASANASAAD